ncbi:ankyrin repeat domain-containing protein [Wolbachia endosymbiont (group B) of Limnophora tigrina]|uniref:ankyrin repeat domain-containing protein n=1 Tax=Wolbachia endosymbiont (group B) of Limnophora tigrina TaxID=3139317 RepID=UPI0035B56354
MILKIVDFGYVLNHSDGSDLLEQLKKWLQEKDEVTYQKWKEKEFDINHQFGFDLLDRYNTNELTLLHIAVQCSDEKVVQALLDKGANVNVQDGYGRTPLHHVNTPGRTKVKEALLKAGADPDIKGFRNKTSRDLAKDENVIKDEENNQIATKAIKTGIAFGVIAGLAIGVGCGVASVQLSVLAIVGIAVAAALAVGLVAGGITYAVLKPSNKLDEPDSNKVASAAQTV